MQNHYSLVYREEKRETSPVSARMRRHDAFSPSRKDFPPVRAPTSRRPRAARPATSCMRDRTRKSGDKRTGRKACHREEYLEEPYEPLSVTGHSSHYSTVLSTSFLSNTPGKLVSSTKNRSRSTTTATCWPTASEARDCRQRSGNGDLTSAFSSKRRQTLFSVNRCRTSY